MIAGTFRWRPATVLTIAGTDPLNGAGVGADTLTIAACGAHPMAVPTALVDQDSTGVRGFHPTDLAWFERMVRAALTDGRPNAVKIGMLGHDDHAHVVARLLRDHLPAGTPVVVDPVLTGGRDPAALAHSRHTFDAVIGLADTFATVVTPNAMELGVFCDAPAPRDLNALTQLARRLASARAIAVLAKGGHITPPGTDVLATPDAVHTFAPTDAAPSEDVHGTGCFLSSALASALALGMPLTAAVEAARAHLAEAFAGRVTRLGAGRLQFVAGPQFGPVSDDIAD